MAKGEQNMLGQGLYKLKRGFWPWALIQKIGSRSLQTLYSLTLYGWSWALLVKEEEKLHGTNEIRGRQTDRLINITHPEVMPFTCQC